MPRTPDLQPNHHRPRAGPGAGFSVRKRENTYEASVFQEKQARPRPGGPGRAARAVGAELKALLGEKSRSVLVAGLGNAQMTPDAIGPKSTEHILVTRHLGESPVFSALAAVSVLTPGVLGRTGIESLDLVRGAVRAVQPDALIVIDALASRSLSRLCTTVQLSDTGIVPGSGVGNSRQEFSRRTLGVPVVAVGVPTVMDAAGALQPALTRDMPQGLLVTLRDVDARVREMGRLVGYGCDLALHRGLSLAEIPTFLS